MASNAARKVDQALRDKISYYIDHPVEYCSDVLRIRTRDLKIQPFTHNRVQQILDKITAKALEEFGFCRACIVKARRQGVSTWIQGRGVHAAATRPNVNVYTIAHEAASTHTIYSIADLMQRHSQMPPATLYHSQQQGIVFRHGSKIEIATAGSPNAARSKDTTFFHGSEVAFWPNPEELATAVSSCIPNPPMYSEQYLESTGNGFGNYFQRRAFEIYAEGRLPYYVDPEDGRTYAWKDPESEWLLVFIPWFASPEYSEPFPSEAEESRFRTETMAYAYRPDELDPEARQQTEARAVMERYGLTWAQIYWRDRKIARDFKGKLAQFRQEYPATLHEAFQSTGGNVFSAELCESLRKLCRPHVFEGTLTERSGKAIARRMDGGPLRIWEGPEPDKAYYLITVDPAGGQREHQEDRNTPDYTVLDVWRRDGRYTRQVAQWHGHIDYDLIGDEAILLGRLYGRCPIAVLRANHGFTVLAKLKDEGWPEIVKDTDGQPGILEHSKTKHSMVDMLVRDLRDSTLSLASTETVEELSTYVERNRRFGAESGCKDDRVSSAYCVAWTTEILPASAVENAAENKGPRTANWERIRRASKGKTRMPDGYVQIEMG